MGYQISKIKQGRMMQTNANRNKSLTWKFEKGDGKRPGMEPSTKQGPPQHIVSVPWVTNGLFLLRIHFLYTQFTLRECARLNGKF